MTGAPKKRSVELLQDIESEWTEASRADDASMSIDPSLGHFSKKPTERGVYSGVLGYWCAGGAGDFSVVIRSAFRYDDESSPSTREEAGTEIWYVGAGGAITALSDPQEEWEEMKTKLGSTIRAFGHL